MQNLFPRCLLPHAAPPEHPRELSVSGYSESPWPSLLEGSQGWIVAIRSNLTLSFKLWPAWQRKFGPLSGEFSLVILPTRVAFLTEPQILRPYSYAFGSIKIVISENLFLLDSRTFFPLQYDRQMDTHTFDAGFILIVCIKIGWGLNT